MRLAMLLMMELVRWPLCVDAELVYHTRFVLTGQTWVSHCTVFLGLVARNVRATGAVPRHTCRQATTMRA